MPDTNPDEVKVLSDDEVAEIAVMFPHAEYQPTLNADQVDPCEFCKGTIDDHKANCVVPHVHALCATVRALREKHTQLAEVSGEWARLLDRIRLWSKCEDGYPLDEHINNIATQNTALREQLAEAQSHLRGQRETIKFWQRHIARMGKLLGTVAMDSEVETAVRLLQSQLAEVTQERNRYADALGSATKGIKYHEPPQH